MKPSRLLAVACALAVTVSCAFAAQGASADQKTRKQAPDKAARKPDPAFAPVVEQPGLPRVLIIGDSISIGYTLPVRARLAGKANVLRPGENCSDSGKGLQRIDAWLAAGGGRWDVIHFNFGLHDLKYLDKDGKYVTPDRGTQVSTLQAYERNLRGIVARMKKTGARIIFATTTQVPGGSSGRVEGDEVRYNEVARRVMREEGVEVNDLHAFVAPIQAKIQRPKNVHFTDEGSGQLGGVVAEAILRALPAKAR